MSDCQYIQSLLDDLVIEEFTEQDEHTLGPAEIHEYLSQLMYGRRSKLDPLWNSLLVGGYKDGKRYGTSQLLHSAPNKFVSHRRFLAYVDLLGTTYSASTLATGYGSYIAQPLLRKAVEGREDTLTEQEAQAILEESLLVLFYRDARSFDKASLTNPHNRRLTYLSTVPNRQSHREWSDHLGVHGSKNLLVVCRRHSWLRSSDPVGAVHDCTTILRCCNESEAVMNQRL